MHPTLCADMARRLAPTKRPLRTLYHTKLNRMIMQMLRRKGYVDFLSTFDGAYELLRLLDMRSEAFEIEPRGRYYVATLLDHDIEAEGLTQPIALVRAIMIYGATKCPSQPETPETLKAASARSGRRSVV